MIKMISVNVLGSRMNILIPESVPEDRMMCVYCDSEVASPFCVKCMEYKGVMSIAQWEEYTNNWGY
jgi:hypothetical protein